MNVMSYQKSQKNAFLGFPFICKNEPSVNPKNIEKRPFISLKHPPALKSTLGFTMVELLVTLAVAAIIVTFAIPNLRTAIQNGRITTITNDFISDVNYARSEALKRGTNVGLCLVADLQTAMQCDGASWAGDRMIFADSNNDGVFTAGEMVLRTRERLASNTLTTINAPNPLIINSRGLLSNSAVPVNFSLCDSRGPTHGRAITISVTGQVVSTTGPGGC